MSAKSRMVAQKEAEPSSELESQQRLRVDLARSSTTLRRAPQLSEDTLDAIQASLEAAFDQLDHLEDQEPTAPARRSAEQARADARRRMPPLPRMPAPRGPPPLPPHAGAAWPPAAPHSLPQDLTLRPSAPAEPQRRTWPRALIASLALVAIAGTTLRVAVPEHPIWRVLERATAGLRR